MYLFINGAFLSILSTKLIHVLTKNYKPEVTQLCRVHLNYTNIIKTSDEIPEKVIVIH